MFFYSFDQTKKLFVDNCPTFIYDPTTISYIQYLFIQLDSKTKDENKSEIYKSLIDKCIYFISSTISNELLILYPWDIKEIVVKYIPDLIKEDVEPINHISIALQNENKVFFHTLSMEFIAGFILFCEITNESFYIPSVYDSYLLMDKNHYILSDRFLIEQDKFHIYTYTIKENVHEKLYGFYTIDFLNGIKTAAEWTRVHLQGLFSPVALWEKNDTLENIKVIKEFLFL